MYLLSSERSPNYGTAMVQRITGLGCACGGDCDKSGLGLFDGGVDFKTWGPMEWALVALGGFAAFSMLSTTRRGVSRVRGGIRKRQSKRRRVEDLRRRRAELDEELRRA